MKKIDPEEGVKKKQEPNGVPENMTMPMMGQGPQFAPEQASAEAAKEAFIKACTSFLNDERRRAAEEAADAKRRLAEYSKEVVEQTRRFQINRIKLASIEALEDQEEARLAADFDKIMQLKGVRGLRVTETGITVFTDSICIESLDHLYEIGQFRADISLDGAVSIINVNNCGTDLRYDHPHIREGFACFGNIREGLAKLIGQCEFATATTLILSYLQMYNAADAMVSINNWPEVRRAR